MFTDAIECYECEDSAYNTTCADPTVPDEFVNMTTIKCKTGACVKWTFYHNSKWTYTTKRCDKVKK